MQRQPHETYILLVKGREQLVIVLRSITDIQNVHMDIHNYIMDIYL